MHTTTVATDTAARYALETDTAATDTLVETAVVSNTFTTLTTNSKNTLYAIPVDPASLDLASGFDCIRAGTGDATAATISVYYLIRPKHGGDPALFASAIVD